MPKRSAARTPAAFIPSLPRLAWTVNSANFPAEAEWTQASFPAVRNPVSSKWTTSALIRCRVMACTAGGEEARGLPRGRRPRATGRGRPQPNKV